MLVSCRYERVQRVSDHRNKLLVMRRFTSLFFNYESHKAHIFQLITKHKKLILISTHH